MIGEEAIEWISQQKDRGYTKEQLYTALVDEGYDPDDATSAVESLFLGTDEESMDTGEGKTEEKKPLSRYILLFAGAIGLAIFGFVFISSGATPLFTNTTEVADQLATMYNTATEEKKPEIAMPDLPDSYSLLETEGWGTYEDKLYLFTLQYPDWVYVNPNPKDISYAAMFTTKTPEEQEEKPSSRYMYQESEHSMLMVQRNPAGEIFTDLKSQIATQSGTVDLEAELIVLGEREYIKTAPDVSVYPGEGKTIYMDVYTLANDGGVYIFEYYVGTKDLDSLSLFDTMLATFEEQ